MIIKLFKAEKESQLNNIEKLYISAFPAQERKPFALIKAKKNDGLMEILSIENENGEFLGLAITILYGDLVLLDYFAISPEYRSNGIGSQVIKLLFDRYNDRRFILEIESTHENTPDREQRLRRKSFYQKNGMEAMDYFVSLFGVKMEIVTYKCRVEFNEYHEIFKNVFGYEAAAKVYLCE